METRSNILEPLLEKAIEYGNTSFELAKLKAIEKTSEVVSSFIADTILCIFITIFTLFLNVGIAIWCGELLGKLWYGFFVLAGFYGILAVIIRVFMYKWIIKTFSNKFIKYVFK